MKSGSTLRKCWMVEPSALRSPHGATLWFLSGRKMEGFGSVSTSRDWMLGLKRILTPFHVCKRQWSQWSEPSFFQRWIWNPGSGKWRWPKSPYSIPPLPLEAWEFLNSSGCRTGCATLWLPSRGWCKNCLGELNLTYALIYLDNVVVFSQTEEETPDPVTGSVQAIPGTWSETQAFKVSFPPEKDCLPWAQSVWRGYWNWEMMASKALQRWLHRLIIQRSGGFWELPDFSSASLRITPG